MKIPLLAALTVPLVLVGCQPRNQFQPPPPPQVTVARSEEREVVGTVEFTGTTQATATVDLRSRVNGYLEEIKFQDGGNVKKGDLLFLIEQDPFKAALASAEASLQKAKASLQLAQAQYDRTERLVARNAVTAADLDTREAELATAKADVALAEAAITQANLDLNYTEIRAPISGRIGRHLVDVGNLVLSEQTSLATIESIDPIHVYFYVSETELLQFMEMIRESELPSPDEHPPELNLGLANGDGYPHHGHLDFRELGVDPGTGTILRRGVFPNKDRTLVPGLFVRISAPVSDSIPRQLVEERAIAADQRGDYLLVVNDKNVVEYRPVKLGTRVGDKRVVLEGIDSNDWVVVNGLQRARPGATVDPLREGEAAAVAGENGGQNRTAQKKTASTASPPNEQTSGEEAAAMDEAAASTDRSVTRTETTD